MEDELVNFEIAVLAKALGFNEICIDTFNAKGEPQDRYNITTTDEMMPNAIRKAFEATNTELNEIGKQWQAKPFISRPTQSLLQRWLREIHNIYIFVEPVWDSKKEAENPSAKPIYCGWYVYTQIEKDEIPNYFNTYEEALNEALKECLQLLLAKKQ